MATRTEELEHDGELDLQGLSKPKSPEPKLNPTQILLAEALGADGERLVREATSADDKPSFSDPSGRLFESFDGGTDDDDGFFFGEKIKDPTLTMDPIKARYG